MFCIFSGLIGSVLSSFIIFISSPLPEIFKLVSVPLFLNISLNILTPETVILFTVQIEQFILSLLQKKHPSIFICHFLKTTLLYNCCFSINRISLCTHHLRSRFLFIQLLKRKQFKTPALSQLPDRFRVVNVELRCKASQIDLHPSATIELSISS